MSIVAPYTHYGGTKFALHASESHCKAILCVSGCLLYEVLLLIPKLELAGCRSKDSSDLPLPLPLPPSLSSPPPPTPPPPPLKGAQFGVGLSTSPRTRNPSTTEV